MARVPARSATTSIFGGRIPPIVLVLLIATVVATVVGAIGIRHGFPLMRWCALTPSEVLRGELWRLVTWIFFVYDPERPWVLLFACLVLYWFGRDLAYRWGPARFALFYTGVSALIGALVVALSLVYRPLLGIPYLGAGPIGEVIIILWAAYYPTRQIFAYFVLAISGRSLILLTIAGTALFAIVRGINEFIPHFLGEALALATIYLPSPRAFWLERKLHNLEKQRRASHLKIVPRDSSERRDPEVPPSGKDRPPGGRWLN